MGRLTTAYEQAIHAWHRVSLPVLRVSLGVVYVWFGALKLTGNSPVATLVRHSVPFVTPGMWFVYSVGVFEIILGLWMITGLAARLVVLLFAAHMVGTFGTLVLQTGVSFQNGNPFMLTQTGEFVVKNLVLLSAGLAVFCWQVSVSKVPATATEIITRTAPRTAHVPVVSSVTAAESAGLMATRET
jgi:uncharacterized membrane protein YphA (DoxX/SURF4 family)